RHRAGPVVSMPTRGGAVALTVPGAVSGWWEAHRFSRDELGSPIAWRTLFDDAIAHARDGIAASTGQRRVTEQAKALFTDDGADEIRKTSGRSLIPIDSPPSGSPSPTLHGLSSSLPKGAPRSSTRASSRDESLTSWPPSGIP